MDEVTIVIYNGFHTLGSYYLQDLIGNINIRFIVRTSDTQV